MLIKGKVIQVKEIQVITEKFAKVEVLVEQQDVKYDAVIPIEFVNKAIENNVSMLKEGSTYVFNINIQGREWKDRHFVSLRCWKVNFPEEQASSIEKSFKEEAIEQDYNDLVDEEGLPF
tara:strand:- start:376 stop:732 length:357 start_codon:yes stop_codon:yes gene_type:complete